MIIAKTSTSPENILSDLIKHTSKIGDCLEWNGCFNTDGYARMSYRGYSNIKVHRFVAELYYKKDISGLVVRHTCDNLKCINPEHLILGAPKDNVKDRDERGRTHRVITKEIIFNVKKLLETKKFSNREIARFIGIDPRRVSDINCGRYTDEGRFIRR